MRTSTLTNSSTRALVAFIAALSTSASAHADDDGWGWHRYHDNARWQHEHWEHEEEEEERREREMRVYNEQQYYHPNLQPRVIYAQPPVPYYTHAPVYYRPPEPFWGINLSFPLDMR